MNTQGTKYRIWRFCYHFLAYFMNFPFLKKRNEIFGSTTSTLNLNEMADKSRPHLFNWADIGYVYL